MAEITNKNMLCAIDIGTSKIVALIAEVNEDGEINIIGMGTQPSKGLKKGVIVNIDVTTRAVQAAIHEAQEAAGVEIQRAYVGIAGAYINSFDSHGVVPIANTEVSQKDLENVINTAKAVPMPADQEILHILYQDFIIDNNEGIKEPVGMSGVRLEARVHMVTASSSAVQNIKKCVTRCDVQVQDIVLEQLASSHAVLSEDEKELGVCMIDIGAGTTDVAVFVESSIKQTFVEPVGGSQVTSDIAHALRVSTDTAERLKIQYGYATAEQAKSGDMIEIPGLADRPVRRVQVQEFSGVIEARMEELLGTIYQKLEKNNLLERLSAGVVLTGGGSKMRGLAALASEIFRVPVRVGGPARVRGVQDVLHNPVHSTGVGLLIYSLNNIDNLVNPLMQSNEEQAEGVGIITAMKRWFSKTF